MIMYLMAIRFEIWDTVKTSYIGPTTSLVDAVGNKIDENNTKSMNAICVAWRNPNFPGSCITNQKNICGTSYILYINGMTRLKRKNCRPIKDNLRRLKMKEEENIVFLFLCVDEIFNTINRLGENVNEEIIVQKGFRSLP